MGLGGTAVVVTGLPASGKTTIARALAASLSFAFLDKDDFLERLFEEQGVGSRQHRAGLSRRSDGLFQEAARSHRDVVLVSHWQPRIGPIDTGTPTRRLDETFADIVEVCCPCTPETATERFLSRRRHAGHLDREKDPVAFAEWMRTLAGGYPLAVGALVEVATEDNVDATELANRVKVAFRPRDLPQRREMPSR